MGKLLLVVGSLFALSARADIPSRFMCTDSFRNVKITDRGSFYSYEIGSQKFRAWEISAEYLEKQVVWKSEVGHSEETQFVALAHLKRVDGKKLDSIPLSYPEPDGSLKVRVFCYDDPTPYPPPPKP